MRRPLSSTSNTCTQSADVDVTDIRVKVSAHYPGRSGVLIITRHQKSANAVVCAGQRTSQEGSSPSGARMRGAISEGGGETSPGPV